MDYYDITIDNAIAGVGAEAFVGIALVFGMVAIAVDNRSRGKLHYPAVLVSRAILDCMASENPLHAGNFPEDPPAFGHHVLHAGIV